MRVSHITQRAGNKCPQRLDFIVAQAGDHALIRQASRYFAKPCVRGPCFLMVGPPGSGKSMLAARLPGILPPLEPAEALGLI